MAVLALGIFLGCWAPEPEGSSPAVPQADPSSRPERVVPPVITVTLPGEPATEYRAEFDAVAVSSMAQRIEARFPDLRAVSCLERAAGIYSRTAQADKLPLGFSEFVLHWSGCPDPFATVIHLLTDQDGEEVFFDHLVNSLQNLQASHIGVARVAAQEPYAWRWTAFLSKREFEMQPVQTSAAPGSSVVLVVRFLRPVQGASVITTHPDGQVVETAAGLSGRRMVAAVEIAGRAGTQWIEVIATDATGPHVVLLFPVEVGRSPPRAWVGARRQKEDWITDPVEAEGLAYELLERDRSRFGLEPLIRDDVLAAVARRHSSEMAQTGEIAHLSPNTGSVADRLDGVGYRASYASENIARSSTIADAQEGLMRSPGHRAAILSNRVSHVGIGIVTMNDPEMGSVHFMTQVFAKPTSGEDPRGFRE